MTEFIGNRVEDHFFAMLLKPGARIECKQLPVVSFGKLDKLMVHVTPSLLVDGKVPLEDWLPFDPGNDGEIKLDTSTYEFGSGENRANPLWKPGKGIPDFQALRMKFIEFKPAGTHTWTAEPEKNRKPS